MIDKKLAALGVSAALAMSLVACGGNSAAPAADDTTDDAAGSAAAVEVVEEEEEATGAAAADASFEEVPIATADGDFFEDVAVGVDPDNPLFYVAGVYFQPVPMAPGSEDISGMDIHLEADVSAAENNAGYPAGSWIPYMTVDYKILSKDGATVAEGSFMEMNADDGPHYGVNVALPEAGTYDLELTFHSPAENGYLIHSDAATGPGGLLEDYFGDGTLTVTFEDWAYAGSMADQAA